MVKIEHTLFALPFACLSAFFAARGLPNIAKVPLLLGLAVILWVAGFDIIYACQDVAFDQGEKLYSIPKRFGIARALWISGFLRACVAVLLALLFLKIGLRGLSLAGLGLVTVLLAYEHSLARPSDLSRVNAAFFTVNGWISVLLFVTVGMDIL
jgi:4-hydroxybenzoate polyprenyltransferase